MAFNPLKENGMPIEKQLRNWSELSSKPYDKRSVHPYTRVRGIFLNGIEVESVLFSHQFARHTGDMELKRKLALVRRVEQQQQKAVNWLIPGDESVVEVTIGYEQVAVDLTAHLARTEPDPYVRQAFEFGLLEDFDHLYRYANLLDLVQGKAAAEITGKYTEITPGRPTIVEHRHPFDDVRKYYDRKKAAPITKLHALTLVAAEQQTMNYYMNIGNRPEDMLGRGLYLEIAQIEEQHVTHYESLIDPDMSWLEGLLMHEYNECYVYYSMLQDETDSRAKKLWEMHLSMEIEHLKMACELMKQIEKRDPEELLPNALPDELIAFHENIDYVREVMAKQIDYNAFETEFLPPDKMPKNDRYEQVQKAVNGDGVPSRDVIQRHIEKKGQDYRSELAGPHPVERLRVRDGHSQAA